MLSDVVRLVMAVEVQEISRTDVERMIDSGEATLVEVLDESQYADFHLPGAINVPLGGDFGEAIERAVPDKSRPVIVYCWDSDCTASPTAAKRMRQMGYEQVYDYAAGKADWKGAGLPVEVGR